MVLGGWVAWWLGRWVAWLALGFFVCGLLIGLLDYCAGLLLCRQVDGEQKHVVWGSSGVALCRNSGSSWVMFRVSFENSWKLLGILRGLGGLENRIQNDIHDGTQKASNITSK